MGLGNREIISELENINEQEQNIVKKTDDVKNDWSKLRIKRSWWYLAAEISLAVLIIMIGFEIALLIVPTDIWHTGNFPGTTDEQKHLEAVSEAKADLYSMILALVLTFLNMGVYLILMYKGSEVYKYNDVALKNNIVYKEQNTVSKKSYWLTNTVLIILIVNFFLFYGFVGLINNTGETNDGGTYHALSAIFSILSIIVPAATVPLGMQYVNKHSQERKVTKRYHDWIKLNATSKYAAIKKVDFSNKLNYLDLSNQLGIDKNVIVIDEKSTGDAKKNIVLYNNIKLLMLKDLLKNYSENIQKRADLYKKVKWKRNKAGAIVLSKSLRNTSIISKIKRYNRKNGILVSVMWNFYAEKFDY